MFDVSPPASPPKTPPEEEEAPKPVQKKEKLREAPLIKRTVVPIAPLSVPMPIVMPAVPESGPVERETAAPTTQPASAAPKVSVEAPETWEGKVLASLNAHRRYPRAAMVRRQQGVPYIRFVMDRAGRVQSASLERSSGFPDLDREAIALPARAQPLPRPPADIRPGQATIELVVPIEYFMQR